MKNYVHGYSNTENIRLSDQARTLSDILHHDSFYPDGSNVLEAGCGIGAQTVFLAQHSPGAKITAVDISKDSIEKAKIATKQKSIKNVKFIQADIFNMPFKGPCFDDIFVCYVLEHLHHPMDALAKLRKLLKRGGSITVIEGDHGSFYCYPESKDAMHTVKCLIDLQARLKGNSLIGRQLYPLLKKADFQEIRVSPRIVYVDSSRPALVDGFSKKTFIAMVEGVKEQALYYDMIDEDTWNRGIRDLYRATREDGTFCYTFFKGYGLK